MEWGGRVPFWISPKRQGACDPSAFFLEIEQQLNRFHNEIRSLVVAKTYRFGGSVAHGLVEFSIVKERDDREVNYFDKNTKPFAE